MRKLLFILLLLPAVASLGHDIYIYQQAPEKGFRITDLGALWDKYHKESHDQWKSKVLGINETIDEMIPEDLITNIEKTTNQQPKEITEEPAPAPSFAESFTQTISKDGKTEISPVIPEDVVETRTSAIEKNIGFILEQKAVFVFSAIAFIAFILNAIFSALFGKKEGKLDPRLPKHIRRMKKKDGGYKYGRK